VRQAFQEALAQGPFGRNVEEGEFSGNGSVHPCIPRLHGHVARQGLRGYVSALKIRHLIFHQGDERRDHHG
jgi:hypothetical protein